MDGLFRSFIFLQFCFLLPSFILSVYLVCAALPVIQYCWQIALLLIVSTLFQVVEIFVFTNLPAAIHQAIHAPKTSFYRHLPSLSPASADFAFLSALLGRLNSRDVGISIAGTGLITGSHIISVPVSL